MKQGFPWGWAAGLWLVGSAVVDQSWLSLSEIQWDLSLPVTRLWMAQQLFYTILVDGGKMILAFDLMRAFLVNSTQPSWPRLAHPGSLVFWNWMTPVLQCLYQALLSYSVIWKSFLFPSQLKADPLPPSEVPLQHFLSSTISLMLVLLLCLQPCLTSYPTSGYSSSSLPGGLSCLIWWPLLPWKSGWRDTDNSGERWFGNSDPGWVHSWGLSSHGLPLWGAHPWLTLDKRLLAVKPGDQGPHILEELVLFGGTCTVSSLHWLLLQIH